MSKYSQIWYYFDMSLYEDIYEVAVDNYGLVTSAEVAELGGKTKDLARFMKDGRLWVAVYIELLTTSQRAMTFTLQAWRSLALMPTCMENPYLLYVSLYQPIHIACLWLLQGEYVEICQTVLS